MVDMGYVVIIPELLPDTVIIIAIFGFNTRLLGSCIIIVDCMSKKCNVRLWAGFTLPQNRERCRAVVNKTSSIKRREILD